MTTWRSRRETRRQQAIAAARREQLDHLLAQGDEQHSPTISNVPNQEHSRRDKIRGPVGKAFLWCTITTLAIISGLLFGGPLFGDPWRPVPLLFAASVAVISVGESARHMRKLGAIDQTWIGAVSVLLLSVFFLGAHGQVVVEGKPYWRNSTTAQSYELALEMRADLYVLQENQSLLFYPPEQARGLIPLLKGAAQQADQLVIRWNPATAPKDLPLPGFLMVYERMNVSADYQRKALVGYAAYLDQPDVRLAEEVETARALAEQSYLEAARELGVILEPLGITLSESVD
jgi:hypothetical protein